MIIDIVMPKMGESITEGTILEWRKEVGDPIALDEILLEIGTDKVDSEIPSSAEGIVVEILAKPNDVVEVGKVIAKIDNETESATPTKIVDKLEKSLIDNSLSYESTASDVSSPKSNIGKKKFYSPVVMKIATKNQLSSTDLEQIPGTGRGGRVTKKDVLFYIDENKKSEPIFSKNKSNVPIQESKVIPDSEEEMSHMRQKISKHMVESLSTSAHVYVMTEVDMSRIVEFVSLNEVSLKNQESYSLTYTPFIVKATAEALSKFPKMNASVVGSKIIYHKSINIGLAVSIKQGLVVPALTNCEEKNFLGFCRSVNDIANRSRQGKLGPDELSGSTFSITNFGVFGVTTGTPIINQPNVGILGVGAIQKKPVVIENKQGDSIGIRSMMTLTLGFDHRLIDGAEGSEFIIKIKTNLETMNLHLQF